jgi:hypothetical protein
VRRDIIAFGRHPESAIAVDITPETGGGNRTSAKREIAFFGAGEAMQALALPS